MARPPLGAARLSKSEYQRRWRAKAKACCQKPPTRPQSRGLNARQTAFVEQYLLDCNGVAAAARAGYRAAQMQGWRLLRNPRVAEAINKAMQERAARLQVDADVVITELAKIGFANMRDYLPKTNEIFDLHRLDSDRTAAIKHVEQEEVVHRRTGDTRRRVHIKLYDKVGALNLLAKHLGLLSYRHEGSLERRIKAMTPEERLERVEELRAKARDTYLPLYEQQQQLAKGQPTIDWTVTHIAGAANDNIATVVEPNDKLLLKRERHV